MVADLNAPQEDQEQSAIDVQVEPVQAASVNAAKSLEYELPHEEYTSKSFGKINLIMHFKWRAVQTILTDFYLQVCTASLWGKSFCYTAVKDLDTRQLF